MKMGAFEFINSPGGQISGGHNSFGGVKNSNNFRLPIADCRLEWLLSRGFKSNRCLCESNWQSAIENRQLKRCLQAGFEVFAAASTKLQLGSIGEQNNVVTIEVRM